jgi:hypothetical protein
MLSVVFQNCPEYKHLLTSSYSGYKDNEEGTRESMHGPDWYKTGDIGYLDDKGYLIIVDRLKDVIKYKGYIPLPGFSKYHVLIHLQIPD